MTVTTPRLPPELERAIFQLTGHIYSRTIPKLLRVAQRVLLWLEPLLYGVLVFNKKNGLKLTEAIKAKPASFLESAVRHVHFGWDTTLDAVAVKSILESCPGIVNLGLDLRTTDPSLLPLLGNMHLQRLNASLRQLFADSDDAEFAVDFEHPLFNSVTHLDLSDEPYTDGQYAVWVKGLSTLPALTHLAFTSPYTTSLATMQSILAASPRLQVLLPTFPANSATEADMIGYDDEITLDLDELEQIGPLDPRLVVGLYADVNYYEDWECGARGKKDIWTRAEEFLARKRDGEIKEDCYIMEV
ncbi:hypothetical protein B0H17DRAFT_317785 [Mycena rosella]|uniref:Uncharacterized protein n=1 Tax=Mycena rosella TaxID=1033263 RepID=A0AAD7DT17_MYCRO|nr:hypothetical protein B0H17DRAFT_317785 [Mycena rosella]